jgi:hypothetical protein
MGKTELEAAIAVIDRSVRRLDALVLIFGALVAIGVTGETIVGIKHWLADRQVRPSRQSLSQLNETEIARLNNDTERLRANNLRLLRALTPRHLNQNEMGENKQLLDNLKQRAFLGCLSSSNQLTTKKRKDWRPKCSRFS